MSESLRLESADLLSVRTGLDEFRRSAEQLAARLSAELKRAIGEAEEQVRRSTAYVHTAEAAMRAARSSDVADTRALAELEHARERERAAMALRNRMSSAVAEAEKHLDSFMLNLGRDIPQAESALFTQAERVIEFHRAKRGI